MSANKDTFVEVVDMLVAVVVDNLWMKVRVVMPDSVAVAAVAAAGKHTDTAVAVVVVEEEEAVADIQVANEVEVVVSQVVGIYSAVVAPHNMGIAHTVGSAP